MALGDLDKDKFWPAAKKKEIGSHTTRISEREITNGNFGVQKYEVKITQSEHL